MKRFAAFLLLLTLCLSGCALSPDERADASKPAVHTIYAGSHFNDLFGAPLPQPVLTDTTRFSPKKPITNPGIATDRSASARSDAPAKRTLTLDGRAYALPLIGVGSYPFAESAQALHRDNSTTDLYEYLPDPAAPKANTVSAEFRQSDGALVTFLDLSFAPASIGAFTDDDAIEKARLLATELYGEDTVAVYDTVKVSRSDGGAGREISVHFHRSLFGYETDDYFYLTFDLSGRLICVRAANRGILQPYVNALTARQIEDAKDAFAATIPEGYEITSTYLCAEAGGSLLLRIGVGLQDSESSSTLQFFFIDVL